MSRMLGWRNKSRASFLRCRVLLVFLSIMFGVTGRSVTQAPDKAHSQPESETSAAEEKPDVMGRSTPKGTVLGFLQHAQTGHYQEAAQYLQLSENERARKGVQIAHQLHELMDHAFVGRVGAISDQREGSVQEGVPHDHECIGVFRINGSETNVDLVHVAEPADGEIWLFSSQILAAVPDLADRIESEKVESRLPGFLVRTQIFGTPLWRLIAFVLLIPVSLGLAWGAVRLLRAGLRVWLRWRHHPLLEDVRDSLVGPATVILTVVFHQIGIYFLGGPLLIRVYYLRLTGIILVAAVAWLAFRLINRWGERARTMALAGSGYRNSSVVLLGQRILKVFVFIVAVLVMFSVLGFDMTAAVAGLGIGSIAIAFAAQKTLENLLGGISIIGDEVIRVGEVCSIGDRVGTVEDISLRSTRIRTLECTLLSVPNGQLANMNVENLSRSDKSLFRTTIGLRQETSSDQLRSLLQELIALLRAHPQVDPEVVRVRFIGFGESSLDIQIHCQILTGKLAEFLTIRENLLLEIMDLLASAGVGLAIPSRSLYLTQAQQRGSIPT